MSERINGHNLTRSEALKTAITPHVAIGAYKDVTEGLLGTALTEGLQTFAVHWIGCGLPPERVEELAEAFAGAHAKSPLPIATTVVATSQELRRNLDRKKQDGEIEHVPQLPRRVVKLSVVRPEDEFVVKQKPYERRIRKRHETLDPTKKVRENGKQNGMPPQGDIVNFK